jgi:methionine-gamma-lyase
MQHDAEISTDTQHGLDEFMTKVVHGSETLNASAIPIYQANSIDQTYARHSNPTVAALEAKILHLEGGSTTIAVASGMAAVSHTLFGNLKQGDRLIVHKHIFFGVRVLLEDYFRSFGIDVIAIDMHDLELLSRCLEIPTQAIYFETMSNPHLDVIDVPAVIEVARRFGTLVFVDNTLLTPCIFRPIAHGADVVIHSATKYLGGHGDALGGIVTAKDASVGEKIRKARRILGGVLSPANAYTLERGLKTLPIRMERHCDNAMKVAAFLSGHDKVREVLYPGLRSSPDHNRSVALMRYFGGMISIQFQPEVKRETFAKALRMCRLGYSFGEPGTVVLLQNWTPVVRISAGLERPEDIIGDLSNALAAC